ncbi:peptidylprolyl isomerase [Hoylesella saccharolytica]|uniref:peptidylprolyl isomerase n=1 Tax=Hoylesella saccharolytica TaxID=633701 RepID=UPI0028F0B07D|nr:peptidylprolyl isomerase [Hoylesella saccharolytica]
MKTRTKIFCGLSAMALAITLSAAAQSATKQLATNNDTTQTEKVVKEIPAIPQASVIDEVIWVVGDEPILKSDVEGMRLQAEAEGRKFKGDPDCSIPEQIAVQKLFLHQAAIDSLEVTESEISQGIEEQINHWVQLIGSREKLEEYRKQSISQIRQSMRDDYKNNRLINMMKEKLVTDVKVSPADVRNYFKDVPADSIPYVPTVVEVEIITQNPKVSQEEINRVKEQLREYTDRVTKGETTFATLARLYSEDPGSARQGGELGYTGRGSLDPAFATVAFNLTDPKKISKIVETEFGYHIIQLIDRRGDKVNVRHILLKPRIDSEAIAQTKARLDSISADIQEGKISFERAATLISDDKDTRSNNGLMGFFDAENRAITSKFRMRDLPTEIAREVEKMKVGDISKAFQMVNARGKTVCAIVKLKARIEGHQATITEDFQVLKNVVLAKEREKVLHNWVVNKIKQTYVRMDDRYKNCNFEYQGWVK